MTSAPGFFRARLHAEEAPAHLAFLLLSLFAVAGSFVLSTDGRVNTVHLFGLTLPVLAPCPFRFLTGFNCPACGMTRCFVYMSHLQFRRALGMNAAGVLLYILCVFEIPYRLTLLLRGRVPLRRLFRGFETALFVAFLAVDLLLFFGQFLRLL